MKMTLSAEPGQEQTSRSSLARCRRPMQVLSASSALALSARCSPRPLKRAPQKVWVLNRLSNRVSCERATRKKALKRQSAKGLSGRNMLSFLRRLSRNAARYPHNLLLYSLSTELSRYVRVARRRWGFPEKTHSRSRNESKTMSRLPVQRCINTECEPEICACQWNANVH